MLTEKMKQEFVRFYNLPLPMTEYNFLYYIELLDPYYETKTKLEKFSNYLSQFQNPEEGYFQSLNKTKNNLLDLFKNKDSGTSPLECLDLIDTKKYQNEFMERQQVYIKPNVGKDYLSIDLKKANFQSFKFIASQIDSNSSFSKILNQCEKFEDLFKLTESDDFFTESKSLRQFIFGNLNPKKQQKIQAYIMSNVVKLLKENFNLEKDISGLNSDELVIEINDKSIVEKIKTTLKENSFLSRFQFHFECFKLDEVNSEYSFFVKRYDSGKIEFKNVPKSNICEVIKFINNKPVQDEDLMFIQDGRLSKFLKPLDFKIENKIQKRKKLRP